MVRVPDRMDKRPVTLLMQAANMPERLLQDTKFLMKKFFKDKDEFFAVLRNTETGFCKISLNRWISCYLSVQIHKVRTGRIYKAKKIHWKRPLHADLRRMNIIIMN